MVILVAVAYKYGSKYIEKRIREVKRYNVRPKQEYIKERAKRKSGEANESHTRAESEGELKERGGIQDTDDNTRSSEGSDDEETERDTEQDWEEFE